MCVWLSSQIPLVSTPAEQSRQWTADGGQGSGHFQPSVRASQNKVYSSREASGVLERGCSCDSESEIRISTVNVVIVHLVSCLVVAGGVHQGKGWLALKP